MIGVDKCGTAILDTIARIDFSELGCHWLEPDPREVHPSALSQRPQCQRLLAEFVDRHGVKPFKIRYRNLLRLFKQGGGDECAKEVLVRYFKAAGGWLGNYHGLGEAFDHMELWGRDGVPLFLIGHPYGIRDEARKTLDAIKTTGLVVSDYHPSWYGYETVQVRVFHHATVVAATGQPS